MVYVGLVLVLGIDASGVVNQLFCCHYSAAASKQFKSPLHQKKVEVVCHCENPA
jgi:hypothetical protein